MSKRYWPQKIHILAASSVFLAILVFLYLIAVKQNRRFDFTAEKIHSLSKETLEVLKRVKGGKIEITAFFADSDPLRREFEILLREMETHHPDFHYHFYDPDRSPSEARKYRIDAYQTTVAAYQGRQERFQEANEEAVTNALIRLAHPKKQTLCFTKGHGEIELDQAERLGLLEWKQVLEDHQYGVREISLLGEGIPEDCRTVILAGPRYELLSKELDLLLRFPGQGKGLWLLIDPMDPGVGKSFDELVAAFGLALGQDVVVDKISRVFGGDYLVPLLTQYADHPVTKGFNVATFFPITRTVRGRTELPLGLKVTELAWTTQGSWAETDLELLEKGEAELDPETDLVGPVPVAAAIELLEAPRGARVIVTGDGDFLTNAYLRVSGNKDLALNMLQWLVKDDRWISIRPREPRFEPLFLNVPQSIGVAAFAIGGLPFTVLVGGSLGLWFRRQRSN